MHTTTAPTMDDLRAAWGRRFTPQRMDDTEFIHALAYGQLAAREASRTGDDTLAHLLALGTEQLMHDRTGKRYCSMAVVESVIASVQAAASASGSGR